MVDKRKASVLVDYGMPFEVKEFDVPTPGPGCLVVEIDVATVCGSDVHVWRGHLKGVLPINPPLILGHEMVGRIVAFGEGAELDTLGAPLALGDRVVWAHAPCGRCVECTVLHQAQLCRSRYVAYLNDCSVPPHFTGAFAQIGYIRSNAGRIRVPDDVESGWASAGSCALRSVVKALKVAGPVGFTDSVVIQGAGPLGLFATAVLSTMGPRQIIVVGGPDDRLALAREWGATHTVSIEEMPDAAARIAAVREISGGGATLALEFAGVSGAFAEGVELLRPFGRYVVMGTIGGGAQPVDVSRIVTKGLRITGSMSGEVGDYADAMAFLSRYRDRFNWDLMLGQRYSLDQLGEAMEAMLAMREIKPVIVP
ncbi:unannotated protein [freshwater metagenome]|uniref:Unannotated protein n=1 Tax=freshwater metagenome TaxID=449393 RepID=A0A6J7JGM1_9ZZZZ|nr:zinc-binding dehydrogenase [Actinomycetota bacterium]MSX37625.1 zinc-binding dehydrogenase [Actinomycetota bacterium]